MTRLPVVNFKSMESIILQLGFVAVRQKGSHIFYRHPDGAQQLCRNIQVETLLAR